MKTLGKFEIIGKVGQGAMGTVYKARDPFIDRMVAIKTLTAGVSGSADHLKRFYLEARSAGNLRHPNIVTIYELGHEGDTPFIAMQFLDGESLDKLILRRPSLRLSEKLGYVVHICRALDHAHKQAPPVIHRDIKPGNVMVTPEGCVVVVDFGIARLGDSTVSQSAGLLIGTLGYMSPQLFRGESADAASDIWAIGVLFYELLAYCRPFEGDSAAALMSKIMLENHRPILEHAPDVPAEAKGILDRMLAKEVQERYRSVTEVLNELEPVWQRLLQKDVSVLLKNCDKLFREGHVESAQSEIAQVFKWDAANPQVIALSDKINFEVRRQNPAVAAPENDKEKQRLLKQRIRDVERMIERQQLTDAVDLARQSITTIGPDSGLSNALRKAEKEIEFREKKRQKQDETIRLAHTLLGQVKLNEAYSMITQSIENNLFDSIDPRVTQVLAEIEIKKRGASEPSVASFGQVPGTELGKDYVYSGDVTARNAYAGSEGNAGKAALNESFLKEPGKNAPHGLQSRSTDSVRTETGRLFLTAVERHLVRFLGPIAAIMVNRVAATTENPAELLSFLASKIPAEGDRNTFLARKDELLREFSYAQSATEIVKVAESNSTPLPSPTSSVGPPPTPAELSHATELLAKRLGPLARILTERAAKRAHNVQWLYLLLAEHLSDSAERRQFLREAGFPQE